MSIQPNERAKEGKVWQEKTVKPISPAPIALLSMFIVMLGWTWLLLFGEGTMKAFVATSAKFRMVDLRSTPVVFVLMLSSVLTVVLWAYLLVRKKRLFFVLIVCSFVFSEVLLRGFSEIAFAIRYVSITVLVSLGITQFVRRFREGLDAIQICGLIYIAWSFINLCVNGFDSTSLAMLPMQLAIVLGFLFGFKSIYGDYRSISDICMVLAWLGVFMTFFHILSLVMVSKPFLEGRFRSAFIYPTNFANAYVLLFVSMVWLAFRETRVLVKTATWCLVLVGFSLLFLSGTRNSLLVFAVVLPIFAIVWKMKVPFFAVLAIVAIGVIGYVFLRESETVGFLGERFVRFSAKTRLEIWRLSWEYIKAKPFIGYGLGKELDVLAGSLARWELVNPHNAYLGIWMQTGLIGLVSMLVIYFVTMFRGVKMLMGKIMQESNKEMIVLPVALLIGLFIAGFFEENLSSRSSIQQLIWGVSVFSVCHCREMVPRVQARDT